MKNKQRRGSKFQGKGMALNEFNSIGIESLQMSLLSGDQCHWFSLSLMGYTPDTIIQRMLK